MDAISAKVIKGSVYNKIPLYTVEVTYPAYIHAEVMTHRVFSRNFQSRRAIPVKTLIERVATSNWYPIFMKNKKGMSATEPMVGEELEFAKALWDYSKNNACRVAEDLCEKGCHKQIANRILEPYSTITGLITATEWDNFFQLRIHPSAQQEIQILAKKIKDAISEYNPVELDISHWHLPFISHDEVDLDLDLLIKLSVARCARVSYLTHDGKRDLESDIRLFNQLKEEKHMSPFEHVATPSSDKDFYKNFRGWIHYRAYKQTHKRTTFII